MALTAGVRAETTGAGPVMKVHEVVASAAAGGAVCRIAAEPPGRVTVYLVSAGRLAVGLRIHWLVVPFRVTVLATAVPAGFFTWNVPGPTPVTASLKVAVMLFATGTAVPFTPGARAVTVGAGLAAAAVVKFQTTVVNAAGGVAVSRIAVEPPGSVAVYWGPAARFAFGFSVAARVGAL